MKTIYNVLLALSLLLNLQGMVQAQQDCRFPNDQLVLQNDQAALYQDYVRRFVARGGHLNTEVKTIPVVVHVFYDSLADSLSLERVERQIAALSNDFRRLNPDTANTRAEFKSVAADLQVEFCLARRDPAGKETPGVRWYPYVPEALSTIFDSLMPATQWNPQRYLNIWVVPTIDGGNSSFPWESNEEKPDGFVVGTRHFGGFDDKSDGFGEGGVVTHEAGHYLGLYHTFEGGFAFLGQCNAPCDSTGDFVCDTPLDWNLPLGIGFCEHDERFCDDGSTFSVQNENFMAYANDTCWNMFTVGQRIRVRATLDSLRAELVSPENLIATGCKLPTDVPSEPLVGKLKIYPQPAQAEVRVEFGEVLSRAQVRLFGIDGRLMVQLSVENEQQIRLPLALLAPGMYVLHVTDGQRRWTDKVVVGR